MNALRHIAASGICGIAAVVMTGCAAQRPADVPLSATVQTEGPNKLVYTADQDGTAWVSDANTGKILYSTRVNRGDALTVDPDNNRILLNGQTVYNSDVTHDNHQIYFVPGTSQPVPEGTHVDTGVARPADVPMAAQLRAEGTDRVSTTADHDGTIWVTDVNNNSVIYSGRVNRGDAVVVDPANNRITVNDQSVYNQPIAHDNHRIFFISDRGMHSSLNNGATGSAEMAGSGAYGTAGTAGVVASGNVARPSDVPTDATLQGDSTSRVDFTAPSEGTVYVTDVNNNSVVYSGRMLRGDILSIDPANNRLTLNGRSVYSHDLSPDERRVFFKPTSSNMNAPQGQNTGQ